MAPNTPHPYREKNVQVQLATTSYDYSLANQLSKRKSIKNKSSIKQVIWIYAQEFKSEIHSNKVPGTLLFVNHHL